MTITTEEAERLAGRHNKESHAWASDGANHDLAQFHAQSAAALFYLAAERDALRRLIGYETAIERLNALDPSLSQDAAAIRAAAGGQAHITKDQQAVFEDALTNSVKIITEKGCAAAGEVKP